MRCSIFVTVAIALAGNPAAGEAQRTATTLAPRTVTSIDVDIGGPPLLAIGDTLLLVARRYRCVGDVCDRLSVPAPTWPRWISSNPAIATIDSGGRVIGHGAGRVTITTIAGLDTVRVAARVLPAVRSIRFAPLARTPRIGDTIQIGVIARDSAGKVVAEIAPVAHIGGTGATGEVAWPPTGSTQTTVAIDRPGLLVLVARLAHRSDTLRVRIDK